MSDTLKKLFRRIQQGVGDLEDALRGDRDERLLDQDIRDTDQALYQARAEANSLKAMRLVAEAAAATARAPLEPWRAEITQLLERHRASKARERAAELLHARARAEELEQQAAELLAAERQLLHVIEQLEAKLRRLKHQLGIVRAAASIQRAQAAVAQRQDTPEAYPEGAQAAAQRARERMRAGTATDAQGTAKPQRAPTRESQIQALLDDLAPAPPAEKAPRARKAAPRKRP